MRMVWPDCRLPTAACSAPTFDTSTTGPVGGGSGGGLRLFGNAPDSTNRSSSVSKLGRALRSSGSTPSQERRRRPFGRLRPPSRLSLRPLQNRAETYHRNDIALLTSKKDKRIE